MDSTHLHLVLTHFPIVGTFIGIGILVYGVISKNNAIKNAAMVTFAVMAILTIPVFLTGEEAEEAVEHLPGVTENIIEKHQELAELAIWLIGVLGILSLMGLYMNLKKMAFSSILISTVLIISLGTFAVFGKVGNLGGQIHHTEIRANTANTQMEKSKDKENHREDDDEDDDDDD